MKAASKPIQIIWRMTLAAWACSSITCVNITRFEPDPCSSHEQCRAAFGFGSICNEHNRCVDSCPRTLPNDLLSNSSKYKDAIKIGHMIDGSNVTQRFRETIIERVFDEVTAASDAQFGVILCSYEHKATSIDDPSEKAIVRGLIDTGVGVVVGPASSKATHSALSASQSEAVFISSSATADDLDGIPLFWRTVPSNQYQVALLKDYLREHASEGAATIYYRGGDPYADGITLAVKDDLEQISSLAFAADTVRVGEVADANTVLFLSPTQNEVVEFLTQSASKKTNYQILLTDSGANTAVFNIVRERLADPALFNRLLERVRGTRPALRENPLTLDVSRELAGQRYDDIYYAFSFDAAWLAFHAAADGSGLPNARSVADHAQGELISLTVDCDQAQTAIPINSWSEVHSARRQKRCLRGYTGVLSFTRHPADGHSRDPLDDAPDGGVGQTSNSVQSRPEISAEETDGYELWCPKLDRGTIKLDRECD